MAVSSEAMLISSVLRTNDSYRLILDAGVTPELFHIFREEWLWIVDYCTRNRRQPSKVAFKDTFPEFRIYQVSDTEHYIDRVRADHARQALMGVMSECADMIATGDVDKAVAYMSLQSNAITTSIGMVPDLNIIDDWQTTYEDAAYRSDRFKETGRAGIPTGLETFDRKTGGIQPGQTCIVAARLGEKKSWTLLRMAIAALMAGFNVHMNALEMSSIEVSMRAHNFLSGEIGKQIFESQSLMMGTEPDMKAYRRFLQQLRASIKTNMTISDRRDIGIPEFTAQLERHRPDAWYIDYLTLASTGGDGGWQDIGRLSKQVNRLAKEYNVATVAAAQLNRVAAQGKGPGGTDTIGGSDQIGQDFGVVIATRELSTSVNVYKVTKNRYGPGGFKWYMHLDPSRGKFEEVNKQRAMDIRDQDLMEADDEDDF